MNVTMLAISTLFSLLAASALSATLGPAPSLTEVTKIAGVPWATKLDTALARAKAEGKPVLLLQLFGRLDDEFC